MSNKKTYSNFEEIDRDLKILRLKSEIAKEELKLSLHDTKEELSPNKLLLGFAGGVATSPILLKFLMPLLSYGITRLFNKNK